MISLAGRDVLHSWGKFVFTGVGLGLLIGVTLVMAGVYRGMVDDGKALLDNSGAELWVVQKDTLGPYAESSSLNDDVYRSILAIPGVAAAAARGLWATCSDSRRCEAFRLWSIFSRASSSRRAVRSSLWRMRSARSAAPRRSVLRSTTTNSSPP